MINLWEAPKNVEPGSIQQSGPLCLRAMTAHRMSCRAQLQYKAPVAGLDVALNPEPY